MVERPPWVSELPRAVLDQLPDSQSIYPSYAPGGGSVHFLKYSNAFRVEFRNNMGETIWYQEFRGA